MKSYLIFLLVVLQFICKGQLPNINISQGNLFDSEPYLAVNPVNAQNMVVAWMSLTYTGRVRISIKTRTSFDGGQTWGNLTVHPHYTPTTGSADVTMDFRKDGTLYLAYIDYRQNPDSGVIYITKTVDGGINWTTPVVVWNLNEAPAKAPIDRPWIAVDNSSTSSYGTLYITTKPAPWIPAPNRPYFKTSADSGLTWSPYRYADTTGHLVGSLIKQPMAALTTTADGAVCVAYPSYLFSQSVYAKYYLARSYNQGASFQYFDLLVNPVPVADTLYKLGYRLASNPANPNQLAFAYIGNQYGDPDIFINTTNDGGQTWSNAVRVNDDAIGNGKAQDMVWISYNEAGDLAAVWRDRRNGTDTGFFQSSDTYGAVSHDNGSTFSKNVRLSSTTAPFDSILMENGNDFMCNQFIGDSIYAVWGDVRSTKVNIYFAKMSDSTGLGTGTIAVATDEIPDFSFYPNPANHSVTVSVPFAVSGLQLTLKMTDATGKLIHEEKIRSETTTIDLQKFPKGTYFITVEGNAFSMSKRLITVN